MTVLTKRQRRLKRRRRVRSRVRGTAERPRLSVYRSNKGVFAQLIDDTRGETLAAVNWIEPELRKLTASISRSNTMVIFINQIRMKIGVMFGNPETTTGGNALKFYASVRLDIRRIGAIKDRDEVVGNTTRVKVVKNKVAPPFKQVEFDIMYGEGVSKMGEILDLGVAANVVEKSGAWFSYDSQRVGQGRENAKLFLRQNPDLANRIEAQVRQNAGLIAEAIMAGEQTGDDEDDEAAEA